MSGARKALSTSPSSAFSNLKLAALLGAKIWKISRKVIGQPMKPATSLSIVFFRIGLNKEPSYAGSLFYVKQQSISKEPANKSPAHPQSKTK